MKIRQVALALESMLNASTAQPAEEIAELAGMLVKHYLAKAENSEQVMAVPVEGFLRTVRDAKRYKIIREQVRGATPAQVDEETDVKLAKVEATGFVRLDS